MNRSTRMAARMSLGCAVAGAVVCALPAGADAAARADCDVDGALALTSDSTTCWSGLGSVAVHLENVTAVVGNRYSGRVTIEGGRTLTFSSHGTLHLDGATTISMITITNVDSSR